MWDDVFIGTEDISAPRLGEVQAICTASTDRDLGSLTLRFDEAPSHRVRVSLKDASGKKVRDKTVGAGAAEEKWDNLKIRRWWPSGEGDQPLYDLSLELLGDKGNVLDT